MARRRTPKVEDHDPPEVVDVAGEGLPHPPRSIEESYPSAEGVRFVTLPHGANIVVVDPDDPIWEDPRKNAILIAPGAFFYFEPPPGTSPERVRELTDMLRDPAAVRVTKSRVDLPAASPNKEAEVPPEHGVRDLVMAEIAEMCRRDAALAPLRERIVKAAESALSGAGL